MPFLDPTVRRDEAAEPVLRRIGRDRQRACFRVGPLLVEIERKLFDPDLTVAGLRRTCGVRDNEVLRRFRLLTGQTVRVYYTGCRLQVAARLLQHTFLNVGQITSLVGYSTQAAFSRAFLRWSGLRPSEYHRRYRSVEDTVKAVELRPPPREQSPEERMEELFDRLALLEHHVDPTAEDGPRRPTVTLDGGKIERSLASDVWEVLRELPYPRQRALVRDRLRFASPALFHLLRLESRTEGRQDRQRGVEIALLALDALHGSAELLGEELPGLRAQGWAWLGNAYRLALDFPAAEQSFLRAEQELADSQPVPAVQAELLAHKAVLRFPQAQFEAGLVLINGAVPILRELDNSAELARALLLRSNILRYARSPNQAISDLQEAEALLQKVGQHDLDGAVVTSWIDLHLLSDDLSSASGTLARARELDCDRSPRLEIFLEWLEGRILQATDPSSAEKCLENARFRFQELDEDFLAAVVDLDLAILFLTTQRVDHCLAILSSSIPVFEKLSAHPGLFAATKLLRSALEQRESLSSALIEDLRGIVAHQALHP